MEMITAAKSEVSSMIRRHFCLMEGDTPGAKCVKRRRRGSSTMAIGCNGQGGQEQPTAAITTTAKRSSIFRGVSRHRWTGRFEAHLWDKGSWNPTQRKKGKQVYLGAYDEEESAGRAYDLAAIKYWGPTTITNFPVSDYEKEMEIMQNLTREEYLVSLRRRSSGFSRGVSKYRGVARHHHNGRWEARIGRVFGNKYLYLGTYGTQEEAARAYDIAAIENRGTNTMTNFDLSTYIPWLRPSTNSLVPQTTTQSHRSPFVSLHSTIGLSDKTNFSFCPNLYTTGDLGKMVSKPEILETKMAISPFNKSSSSPTALSLLLKSSIFRELVEKTSTITDGDETKQDERKKPLPSVGKKEKGEFVNENIGSIPYGCCSNSRRLPGLVSEGEDALPLHNRKRAVPFEWCLNHPLR